MGMIQLKSVTDYFEMCDPASRHREMYYEYLRSVGPGNERRGIDLRLFERSIFSSTERNILLGFSFSPKFKSSDLLDGFKMETRIYSQISQCNTRKDSLEGKRKLSVKFKATTNVCLTHNRDNWIDPIQGTLAYRDDAQIRSKMEGYFNDLSPEQFKTSSFISVAEKICAPSCCRSMMLKGYLYLCEMVFQKSHEGVSLWHSGEKVRVLRDITQFSLLAMMDTFSVVVDVDCFSVNELALMSMICCSYPCVKFGEGKTIYNSLLIPAEDAALVVSKDTVTDVRFDVSSPDLLYMTLVQLAGRLGCLEQLREVIQDFRGVPYYLHNIEHFWNFSDSHMLNYQKSNSLVLATPAFSECRDQVTVASNFLATTACIISDNLFGQAMISTFFTYGEYIGAFGEFGCPTGVPATDPIILTRHVEMGVDHQEYVNNVFQTELYIIRGREMPVAVVDFRPICNAYFEQIRNSKTVSGMFSPCVLLDIPYSNFHNTSWGVCRGFSCESSNLCVPARVYDCARKRVFAWVNGRTEIAPTIGLSILGSREPIELTMNEHKWFANTLGEYRVTTLTRTANSVMCSSHDWMEKLTPFLFKGPFRGSKTIVTFTTGNVMTMLREEDPDIVENITTGQAGYESFTYRGPRGTSNLQGVDQGSLLRIGRNNTNIVTNVSRNKKVNEQTNEDEDFNEDEADLREKGTQNKLGPPGNRFKNPHARPLKIKRSDGKYLEYSNTWFVGEKRFQSIESPNEGNRFGITLNSMTGTLTNYVDNPSADYLIGKSCFIVQTPGDGHCGLWALLYDFCLRGRVDMDGFKAFTDEINNADDSLEEHRGCDLFLAVADCGMGVIIYHESVDSNNETYFWVETFGTKDAIHNVRILSREIIDNNGNCRLTHHELLVPGDEGNFVIPRVDLNMSAVSSLTPAEEKRAQEKFRENKLPTFKMVKSRGQSTGPVNFTIPPNSRETGGNTGINSAGRNGNQKGGSKPGDEKGPNDGNGSSRRGGGGKLHCDTGYGQDTNEGSPVVYTGKSQYKRPKTPVDPRAHKGNDGGLPNSRFSKGNFANVVERNSLMKSGTTFEASGARGEKKKKKKRKEFTSRYEEGTDDEQSDEVDGEIGMTGKSRNPKKDNRTMFDPYKKDINSGKRRSVSED